MRSIINKPMSFVHAFGHSTTHTAPHVMANLLLLFQYFCFWTPDCAHNNQLALLSASFINILCGDEKKSHFAISKTIRINIGLYMYNTKRGGGMKFVYTHTHEERKRIYYSNLLYYTQQKKNAKRMEVKINSSFLNRQVYITRYSIYRQLYGRTIYLLVYIYLNARVECIMCNCITLRR